MLLAAGFANEGRSFSAAALTKAWGRLLQRSEGGSALLISESFHSDYGNAALLSLLPDEAALKARSRCSRRGRDAGGKHRERFETTVTLICCLLLMAVSNDGRAEEPVYDIDIPSMNAAEALNRFAEQTGAIMLFPYDLASAKQANAVHGRYTLLQGLELLLQDTGLSGGLSDKRVVSIAPVARADQSREEGDVGQNKRSLAQKIVAAVGAVIAAGGVSAQEPEDKVRDEKLPIEEILVTGTRLPNSDIGSANLVQFDRNRIDELGVSNVADVLKYVTQQPFPGLSEQNSFAGVRTVQLRGLGLGTTLILINGRRAVSSALSAAGGLFDLNTIPLSAVKRIDVLASAASAVYGSDAVGGVVNIVLKESVEATTVDLYWGTAEGGAEEERVSLTFGGSGPRFRGLAVVDYFRRGSLPGEERSIYADNDFRRFGDSDGRSVISNPGNVLSATSQNLPGLPSTTAAVPVGSTGIALTPTDFLATAGHSNRESLRRFSSVVPAAERASLFATAEYEISRNSTLFGELLYAERTDERTDLPAFLVGALVPESNAFNPFGGDVLVHYLFEGLDSQINVSNADTTRAAIGLRGLVGKFAFEASILPFKEDASNYVLNNIDAARVNAALASSDPSQALNVFQDGPGGSSELLSSLIASLDPRYYSSEALQWLAFMRGALFTLPSGPFEIVLGVETRQEELFFRSGDVDANRETHAAFAELRAPIVNSDMNVPLMEALSLTLAGRYDDYSDFGSTFNPQYGLSWTVVPSLVIRATGGSSYRAPTLFELYSPRTVRDTSTSDPQRGGILTPYTLTSGGNPELGPEESDSWTVGVEFDARAFGWLPARTSVVYWSVTQDRRVQRMQANLILANELLFPDRITRAAPSAADIMAGQPGPITGINSTSINFGRLQTDGVDLDLTIPFETPMGSFTPQLRATWINKYDAADFPNTPVVDRVGVANTQGTIPEWRGVASVGWNLDRFSASVAARYIPSYRDATRTNVPTDRRVGAQTFIDAQGSIRFGDEANSILRGMTFRVGVSNALDGEPEFSVVSGIGFDSRLADTRQRFVYASFSKQF